MSDKTINSTKALNNAELELTQKFQVHFPRGILSAYELALWNGYPKEVITARLAVMLGGGMSADRPPIGRYFMSVKLGVYKSAAELRQAVLASGKKINKYADQILNKITVSPKEIELDLYEVSVRELGFTSSTSRENIYKRASKCGFKKCPAEVGPLARIQCAEEKMRIIGMDQLTAGGFRSVRSVFELRNDDNDLQLYAANDGPDLWLIPDHVLVWVWPRRK